MSLQSPEWWLLALPLAALWLIWLRRAPRTRFTRLAWLLVGVLALSDPQLSGEAPASAWFLLVDRSASVQGEALARARALLPELQAAARRRAAQLYVIGFGRGATLLAAPSDGLETLNELTEQDDSDLAAALELAASLAPRASPAEMLVVSDGLFTADDPRLQAASLRARGIRVHALPVAGSSASDAAITRVIAPPRVPRGQRFTVAVEIESPLAGPARLRLQSALGSVLGEQSIDLVAGTRRYAVPLVADQTGAQPLDAMLDFGGDTRPGNNRAHAVVQVVGPPRVIVYNARGVETALVRALSTSGLELELRAPGAPLTTAGLQDAAAVVLENVALSDLGDGADVAIAGYVDHMAGGLLVTGGRSSYALGGYYRSQLDGLLPVAMDRQQELRRPRVDMAIALDRSGSMAVPASDGTPKMDLADRAAAEAIALLAPGDGICVLAVDSAAHEVVPLQTLSSTAAREEVAKRVLSIESEGGGIFVYTALAAAMDALLRGSAATRHIVLFADAADAEEPGDYKPLIERWRHAGGTLSVIGLGTTADPDAGLLREIAELGGGQVYFTGDALQLPRVFAQDVMYVARKTFVEAATEVLPARGLAAFGLAADAIPATSGYNLGFLREGAEAMLVAGDENRAPLAAGWQHGSGKVMAVTFEADGPFTGAIADWSEYKAFFRAGLEWVKRSPAPDDLDASVELGGRMATLYVALPPDHRGPSPSRAWILSSPDGESRPIALHWNDPSTLSARFPIESGKLYQAVVERAGTPVVAPPWTLPYSPELAPARGDEGGDRVLAELVQATSGTMFVSIDDFALDRSAERAAGKSLTTLLAAALLALLLFDIAHRRGLLDPFLLGTARYVRAARARVTRRPGRTMAAAAPEPAVAHTAEAQPAPAAGSRPASPQPAAGALEDPLVLAKRKSRRR